MDSGSVGSASPLLVDPGCTCTHGVSTWVPAVGDGCGGGLRATLRLCDGGDRGVAACAPSNRGYLRDIRASDVDEMALTDPSRNTDQGV